MWFCRLMILCLIIVGIGTLIKIVFFNKDSDSRKVTLIQGGIIGIAFFAWFIVGRFIVWLWNNNPFW